MNKNIPDVLRKSIESTIDDDVCRARLCLGRIIGNDELRQIVSRLSNVIGVMCEISNNDLSSLRELLEHLTWLHDNGHRMHHALFTLSGDIRGGFDSESCLYASNNCFRKGKEAK